VAVDPFARLRHIPAIGPGQRVDFKVRQFRASVAQRREGGNRSLEKIGAELLVCQNLPYDQLHVFLRHRSLAPVAQQPCLRALLVMRIETATLLPGRTDEKRAKSGGAWFATRVVSDGVRVNRRRPPTP
jgi:hypothetical protein